VYINGALVDRRELPPGRFEIDNVAVPAGRGSATVLIRDAFGGERIIAEPYYASSLVLGEGLSEYSYSLGALRKNESSASFDYGDPAFIASHRWGITDRVTAGYRAEGTEDLWSAGGSVAARFLLGEVAVLAGASEARNERGTAIAARYAYITRTYSAAVSWMRMSDQYATISLAPELDRSTERVDVLTSLRLGRLDFSLHGSVETRRDSDGTDRVALLATWPIADRVTVFTSAGVSETEGDRTPELAVGVTWNLGFLRSAALRFDDRGDGSSLNVSVQQNLAREPGWGYRLDGTLNGDDDTSSVLLQRQTDDLLLEVSANPSVGSDTVNVSASGGLAWGGGRVHLMRAGQQSYAVVRVPGVEGVRVYVSNLEAGRTDANGELVVTDLVPYYGNRIRIEDADIPMNYRVDDTERIIAPPLRGGVVVEFAVAPATSVGGIVVIQQADGSIRIPATGELRLRSSSGERATSPLGRGAEFYFEDIAPGAWDAEVVDEKGICRMTLRIDSSDQPMQDVGTVTCKEIAP
ncbi:MAG TPA: fimbria/pilus outer membrane usher protein, partial [Thermoanaerobaculia bacterium]|nr:fimbria/pilus outer membrane usher protein [Thermoanaerobaculia bacterium]